MNTNTFSHTWGIEGHTWAVDHLRKSMLHNRLRHAYLIVGAESIGKSTLAHAFAMALNCQQSDPADRPCGVCSACLRIVSGNYPDVFYANLDNNLLKVEEMRRMTAQIALKPFEARSRVAIFPDFDHARPQSQDAMLKTLEEPAPTAVLILIAQSLDLILPTITSRSQVLHLRPVAADIIRDVLIRRGAEADQAELLASLSGGRIGWAIHALQDPSALEQRTAALTLLESAVSGNRAARFGIAEDLSKDKSALEPLLDLWLSYWRDLLMMKAGGRLPLVNIDHGGALRRLSGTVTPQQARLAVRATQTLIGLLATNANVRLALEVMFLDYPGLNVT